MFRSPCRIEKVVSGQKVPAFCVGDACRLSLSRQLWLGLALVGILIAFPGGELLAQRGNEIPFLQDYSTTLTGSVGVPDGAVPTPTIPFALNSASFNGRVLGADLVVRECRQTDVTARPWAFAGRTGPNRARC